MIRKFMMMTFLNLLFSCTHSIHNVHTSGFSPFKKFQQGTIVREQTKQDVILGLSFDTNYVDLAYIKLQKKCPKGRITGITTQYSTSHGFFSWTNKIFMQGLCIK